MSIENPTEWNDDHPIGPRAIYKGISGNIIVTSPPKYRSKVKKPVKLCNCCGINEATSSASLYCNDCKVEKMNHYGVCPVSGIVHPKIKDVDDEV